MMKRNLCVGFGLGLTVAACTPAVAQVRTVPTTDTEALKAALGGTGLTIDEVIIRSGAAGQFGTYNGFDMQPVTIRPGVVLSSGDVSHLEPFPEATQPGYDPSSPPPAVNTAMSQDPDTFGATPEFNAYGLEQGRIENFNGSYDVAALEVHFTLDAPSQVRFDFIFGSVEYPYWTSQYTDAFLVFLDGTDPQSQITFDSNGHAVQVGASFAGLETTTDLNTAFSNPHALIHHLTTTTAELNAGPHTLIFEVGDVNDQALDSAAFISRLRTGFANQGTDPTEDDCSPDFNGDGDVGTDADIAAFFACLSGNCCDRCGSADYNGDGDIGTDADIAAFFRVLGGGSC